MFVDDVRAEPATLISFGLSETGTYQPASWCTPQPSSTPTSSNKNCVCCVARLSKAGTTTLFNLAKPVASILRRPIVCNKLEMTFLRIMDVH